MKISNKPIARRMMLIIGMCLFAAMTVDRAHSQSLSSAFTQGTSALQSAQEELAALRNQITQEKIPMSSELRAEEAKVLTMRREVERMQRMNDTRGLDLRNLEVQLKSRTDELQYVSTLLTDYVNRLNSELNPSEFGVYGDKLLEIINITDDPNISKEQIFQSQLGGISLGLERMKDIVGGKRFPGKAVLPDGKLGEGSFAMVGPLVYFASADGKFAGLAERGPSLEPRLVQFDDTAISSIAEVISSGKGEIPMDLTLGKAAAIATTKETVVEHILKGGIWMGPILLFAVVSLILGVYKAVEMKTVRKLAPGVLSKVLTLVREDNNEEAKEFLKQHKGPASDMLQDALKSVHLPKELLEEFMFENILSIQPKLERGLAIISTTAAVAPLLGLLGTVTGMINTFKLITLFGTGDARSLSSGISEALITTEFGLIVAIPALLLSAYLSRKSSGILADMERVSISFVNGVVAIKNPSPYSVREKEAFSK